MSATYTSAKERSLTTGLNLLAGTVTAHLVTDAYVPSASHTTVSQLGANVVKTATLAGKAIAGGKFTSSPIVFSAVTGASPAVRIVFSVGTDLVGYADDFGAGPGATSMPLNGSDIQVSPDPALGWFTVVDA